MKQKELKIVAPEGYEVDKENSTFERIVFKKKDDKPRSWEEYANNISGVGKFFINEYSSAIVQIKEPIDDTNEIKQNLINSKEEAEAFVALMQLRQLRKAWVGDWEPNWCDDSYKYAIEVYKDDIQVYFYNYTNKCLSFPTEEMAIEFVDCFRELLEQAKMLL